MRIQRMNLDDLLRKMHPSSWCWVKVHFSSILSLNLLRGGKWDNLWVLPNLATLKVYWGHIYENSECCEDWYNYMVLLLTMDFLNLLCQKTLPRNIILFQKTLGNHISDRSIWSYYWNMGSSTFTFIWEEQEPLDTLWGWVLQTDVLHIRALSPLVLDTLTQTTVCVRS